MSPADHLETASVHLLTFARSVDDEVGLMSLRDHAASLHEALAGLGGGLPALVLYRQIRDEADRRIVLIREGRVAASILIAHAASWPGALGREEA